MSLVMKFNVERLEETPKTYLLTGVLECTSNQDSDDMSIFVEVLPKLLSSDEFSKIGRYISVSEASNSISFRNIEVSSLIQIFKLLKRNTGCDFRTDMGNAVCMPASCSLKFYHTYRGESILF